MQIITTKRNIRSNHTIRFGGYNTHGTKRNGIVNAANHKDIIKFDSKINCCRTCGGKRYNCKTLFTDHLQYRKKIYRNRKSHKVDFMDDYNDYIESYYD